MLGALCRITSVDIGWHCKDVRRHCSEDERFNDLRIHLLDHFQDSRHVLMTATTEDIAEEPEHPNSVGHECYFLDNARLEVGMQMKLGQVKAVVPVLADQFECHGSIFFHRDFVWCEFEGRS